MTGTLNKVMLIGHTGDDVKMHYFEGGGSVGRFPLATNEVYTNKTTGQRVENTEWHNIVVRNKAAEICEKYLKKGDKVYVEGRLKTRKWQDEKGNERYSTEIQCTDFTFLTPKDQNGPGQSAGGQNQYQNQSQPRQNTASNQAPGIQHQEEEDDLPF
ncbi:single-stranded DNA-binding protein [Salinimicrobium gaetbulicola]|uniref:Single-stranded DNA-binding protein n=1 Tax=Salinimicrobium gaetbulicola TaxID=999702 RepID=A0ABW3IHE9_9FLAO